MRTPLLKRTQILRLARILDMMYKPSELAREIEVTNDTIYRCYLPAGLPYTREGKHVWIHGPAFVAWAKVTVAQKRSLRTALAADQAWCMKCNQPVVMQNVTTRSINRYAELMQAKCPICHCTVNRMRGHQLQKAAV